MPEFSLLNFIIFIFTYVLNYNNLFKLNLLIFFGENMADDKKLDGIVTQDLNCPRGKRMWDDLAHGGGPSEWKCLLQDYRYGDLSHGGGSECLDYHPCNNSDHRTCRLYLERLDKK